MFVRIGFVFGLMIVGLVVYIYDLLLGCGCVFVGLVCLGLMFCVLCECCANVIL